MYKNLLHRLFDILDTHGFHVAATALKEKSTKDLSETEAQTIVHKMAGVLAETASQPETAAEGNQASAQTPQS